MKAPLRATIHFTLHESGNDKPVCENLLTYDNLEDKHALEIESALLAGLQKLNDKGRELTGKDKDKH